MPNAGNAPRGLLQKAIDEKTEKYKDANPGKDLEKPKKAAVSNCVRRSILDPERHRLDGAARGPKPVLANLDELILAFVEEATYQSASGDTTPEILTHAIKNAGARAALRARRSKWWAPFAALTATTWTRRCWTP